MLLKRQHSLGFFPKRNIATLLVFSQVRRNSRSIPFPDLDDDRQTCEALVTLFVKLFRNTQPGIPATVDHVTRLTRTPGNADMVQDPIGPNRRLDLVIEWVYFGTRVKLVPINIGNRQI